MPAIKTLEIAGYRDQPVPNTFFEQKAPASQLAIVLPGVGYTCHMPVLFLPTRLFLTLGMDVLWVEYNYSRRPDYGAASDDEQERWLATDVAAACRAALAQRSYRQVALVGKSLGTLAMSRLLARDSQWAASRPLWLTPVLRDAQVRAQIESGPRGLVVIGTADQYYDAAYLASLRARTRHDIVVVEGADHILEIKGDVWASLRVLEQLLRAVEMCLLPR